MKTNILTKITATLFWVAVWAIGAMLVGEDLLLPSPASTLLRLCQLAAELSFWQTLALSFLRVAAGIAAAILIGILGGILTGSSRICSILFEPFLAVLKATPVASFIVLLALWLERGLVPFVVSCVTILPVIWTNIESGIRSADPLLAEFCRAYRIPLLRKIRGFYLPSVRPYFRAAIRASLGMAWKSAVAAEVIVMPVISIGRRMHNASNNLDTAGVFAWTILVVVFSLLAEKLVTLLTGIGGNVHE